MYFRHFTYSPVVRLLTMAVCAALLLPACIKEDLSGCLPENDFFIKFSYTFHTHEGEADRFSTDLKQLDLFVFDSDSRFVKHIEAKGDPFPSDFRINPELPEGKYTVVAWGNLTEQLNVTPEFIAGQTTLEQARIALRRQKSDSVNYVLTPYFHASKEINVVYGTQTTEVLSLIKNTNQVNVKVAWYEKDGSPCLSDCARGAQISILSSHGGTYKFDNTLAASSDSLLYHPYQTLLPEEPANRMNTSFSLMRLEEGHPFPIVVERRLEDGTLKELFRGDLLTDFILRHPSVRSQTELDRQDLYEIELQLVNDMDDPNPPSDDKTHMLAAITVEGWRVVLQEADMGTNI